MTTWQDRHDLARKHVLAGRQVIERQRALIERIKALGLNTASHEELLVRFETSQAIFEADLVRIAGEKH
jgi:hypothetical protein